MEDLHVTKLVSRTQLNEKNTLTLYVTRVPGGYLYSQVVHTGNDSLIFVPEPPTQSTPQSQPTRNTPIPASPEPKVKITEEASGRYKILCTIVGPSYESVHAAQDKYFKEYPALGYGTMSVQGIQESRASTGEREWYVDILRFKSCE